jgi:hypothetical protein
MAGRVSIRIRTRLAAEPDGLSPSWPGVSRPSAPGRWGRRGGCTTAGARVAGTRSAMTRYPDAYGAWLRHPRL